MRTANSVVVLFSTTLFKEFAVHVRKALRHPQRRVTIVLPPPLPLLNLVPPFFSLFFFNVTLILDSPFVLAGSNFLVLWAFCQGKRLPDQRFFLDLTSIARDVPLSTNTGCLFLGGT